MEKVEQFVKVPTKELKERGLDMKDIVIYAYLKKHYNHVTKEAFPSMDLLVKESGISKPTVMKCLNNLVKEDYIQIKKKGKPNHYTFSDVNKFEIYSFDFLDDPTLTTNQKAYMICMQPHMFKDKDLESGKITYSEMDIANILNIDLRTLRKYESGLQQGDKPILTIVPTKKKDPLTGLAIQERIFDFAAYNNLVAIKFMEVQEELNTKASKEELQHEINKLTKENEMFKKELWELKKLLMTKEVFVEKLKEVRV